MGNEGSMLISHADKGESQKDLESFDSIISDSKDDVIKEGEEANESVVDDNDDNGSVVLMDSIVGQKLEEKEEKNEEKEVNKTTTDSSENEDETNKRNTEEDHHSSELSEEEEHEGEEHENKRRERHRRKKKRKKKKRRRRSSKRSRSKDEFGEIDDSELIIDEKDSVIGKGGTSVVKKGVWKARQFLHIEVAIKEIEVNKADHARKREVIKEFRDQVRLKHPLVLPLFCYSSPTPNLVRIVMEKMDMDTYKFVTKHKPLLSEKIAMMSLMASSVHFLHNHDPPVIHRDIKPANFLVKDSGKTIKICDFGLVVTKERGSSTFLIENDELSMGGTTPYISPETIEDGKVSLYGDIYALGITFWEILFAKHCYENLQFGQIMYQVVYKNLRPKFEYDDLFEDKGKGKTIVVLLESLLTKMWSKEPKERCTSQELKEWFETNEEELKKKCGDSRFPF